MTCADGRRQSARCPIIGKQRLRTEIILLFMPEMLTAWRIPADGLEQFFLYAREESLQSGGAAHSAIIAGHTPTTVRESFAYNAGKAFRYYDAGKNCVFYDIDCGCVFRERNLEARLACIRLEDEKIFYA